MIAKFFLSCDRKIIHHGPDLGGHLNYTKRFTNYTIQSRIAKTRVLWDLLRRSSAPQYQKLRATFTVAWPRCLHGIAGVTWGMEHVGRLRSSLMQAMGWNKKGASPILQCLLMSPRCDPWFYTLVETVMVFRTQCTPDAMFPVLTGLVLNPPSHFNPGPAGVFLARLHALGWKWDHHGFIVDHEGLRWHLIDAPVQLVRKRLQQAWAAAMGALVSTRKEFHGMCMVDVPLSRSTQQSFAVDGTGILRTAMNGTFYTRNKQIHAGKVPSKACPHCGMEDSVAHRVWQCEGFADLRDGISEATKQFIRTQPECTQLHGWFVEPVFDRSFRAALHDLPEDTGVFEHFQALPEVFHLFTDGSCSHPTKPAIRMAFWGVSLAMLPASDFQPVSAGAVPGIFQSALRGEILAAVSACRFALLHKRHFYSWVDNETVFKRIRAYATQQLGPPTNRKHDHDLWQRLWYLVQICQQRGLLQQVVKVTSHQRGGDLNAVDEWVNKGNASADRTAAEAVHHLPTQLAKLAKRVAECFHQRFSACQEHHQMLVQFGLRDVESKVFREEHDQQKWDTVKQKGDNREVRVSLQGIPRLMEAPDHHGLGDCLPPLHDWLFSLTTAADATPIWLSSYQLLMHYQAVTGGFGFEYRRRGRQWLVIRDPESQFGFLQRATWMQSLLRNYASLLGHDFDAQPQLPWGSSFRSWQRCILIQASTSSFARIDQTLRRQGIAGLKTVKALDRIGQFKFD